VWATTMGPSQYRNDVSCPRSRPRPISVLEQQHSANWESPTLELDGGSYTTDLTSIIGLTNIKAEGGP